MESVAPGRDPRRDAGARDREPDVLGYVGEFQDVAAFGSEELVLFLGAVDPLDHLNPRLTSCSAAPFTVT
jgi:hypothetical protein